MKICGVNLNCFNSPSLDRENSSETAVMLEFVKKSIPEEYGIDKRNDFLIKKNKYLQKILSKKKCNEELNLEDADLSGVDLSSLVKKNILFCCVNLTNANLTNANLTNANLTEANLTEANLTEANLTNATLTEANLTNATLTKANLTNATLTKANLTEANLTEANLTNATLTKANLNNATLTKANLNNATLTKANLNNATLTKANLNNATLTKATLASANLTEANLTKATLASANLTEANLASANLTDANLNYAFLSYANLSGTDFTNANILRCYFRNAEFDDHTKMDATISFCNWNESNLDIYLNSENNDSSVFATINTIPDNYQEQKITWLHGLIDSLNQRPATLSLAPVTVSLLDNLTKLPYCNQDKKISDWLSRVIVPLYLENYNNTALKNKEDDFCEPVLCAYNSNATHIFRYNALFIQLISQLTSSDSRLKEQAQQLYNNYLQHTRIHPYVGGDFGDYDGHPDWSDEDANNLILVSQQENDDYTMIMSQNQLHKMLNIKPRKEYFSWNAFYLYQGQKNMGSSDYQLNDIFDNHFPLFATNYRFEQNQAQFKKLLDTLSLGEFTATFISATTKSTSEIKFIDADSQFKLAGIFNKTFEQYKKNEVIHYRLTSEYQQQLLAAYQLTKYDVKKQAETLLSLAAVFSQYSSSAIFGTETESPNVLRYFASALVDEAYQRSPTIFENDQQYQDWTNRLLGYNNAFSCTEVLSNIMVEHIKKHFPNTLANIKPPAWN